MARIELVCPVCSEPFIASDEFVAALDRGDARIICRYPYAGGKLRGIFMKPKAALIHVIAVS